MERFITVFTERFPFMHNLVFDTSRLHEFVNSVESMSCNVYLDIEMTCILYNTGTRLTESFWCIPQPDGTFKTY